MPRQVLRFAQAHDLLTSPGPIVVGVSGGVDSVCLLHVLASIRHETGIELHAAHLNHKLRGAESDADAEYVAELCGDLGINVTIESRSVKRYRARRRCSLEEAAREVRYNFFREVLDSVGADAVAVAHTANDQAETILMHLIRGTGLSGLVGMRPSVGLALRNGRYLTIVRPLLEVTRGETLSYCVAHGLKPREDSSNRSLAHLRNRVRAELLPLLGEYNPSIIRTLCRSARIFAEDMAYLDDIVRQAFDEAVEETAEGLALDNQRLMGLHPAVRSRLIRAVLARMIGSPKDIELDHIEGIMSVLSEPAGKEFNLPHGLTFYGDYGKSVISRGENPGSPIPSLDGEVSLTVPGETTFGGWRIETRVFDGKPRIFGQDHLAAQMDLDAVGTRLHIRSRRAGDRFHPLGMSQPKKLKDFMIDSKIPRSWRDDIPLVCNPDRIVWVVGWRIDDRARVTDSTHRTVEIRFELE